MLACARLRFAGERVEYEIPAIIFKNLLLDHLIVLPCETFTII